MPVELLPAPGNVGVDSGQEETRRWGMDERAEADEWVCSQLDVARQGFRRHRPGPGDLTLEQYEQRLRQRADLCPRPTSHYVGLALHAAEALAALSGDSLCVHRGPTGHRANWRGDRVYVELNTTNQVTTATRDAAPWR